MDTSVNNLYQKICDCQDNQLNKLFEASLSGDYFDLKTHHALVFLQMVQNSVTEKTEIAILLKKNISGKDQSSVSNLSRKAFFWKNGKFGRIIPCPHVKYRFQDEAYLNDRLSTSLAFHLKTSLAENSPIPDNHAYVNAMLIALIRHLHILDSCYHTKGGKLKAKMTPAQIKKVKTFIDDHIDRKIYVFELAALLNVSEGYFYEAFKHSADITPYECITNAKMDHAKKLLAQCNSSIIQIGMAVGYDNPSHFCKIFKKLTGITPSGFQKSYRTIGNES